MHKPKNHSPISLFSFQDLMISMIGIFIIIALLLILLITKQVAEAVENSSMPIDKSILTKLDNSKEEIKQLEALIKSMNQIDLWEVTSENLSIKDELLDIDLDLVEIREKLDAARMELDRIIIESELEGDVGVGLALRLRRDALLEELDETRLRDRIVYLVAESDLKKPLIMELSENQIIISTSNQSFSTSLFSDFEYAITDVQSILDTGDYYLLVVLKPSGMRLWKQLKHYVLNMKKKGKNIDLGLDLIAENHATTNNFLISPTK